MEINEYLIKLMHTVKDMETLELLPDSVKLNKTEFRLLREVIMEREAGRDIISSELARRLGVTRSAISQLVTKLEERDIVRRVDALDDKKIAYVRLSNKALTVYNEQCEQANKLIEKVVEEFGEERLKSLIAQYDELASIFARVQKEMRREPSHKE